MFDRLGVPWACSLLGFVSIILGLVPFAFIRFGEQIRANSKFCQQLAAEKERLKEEQIRRGKKREARERKRLRRARDEEQALEGMVEVDR